MHIKPIQELSSAIHEKLFTSNDADIIALQKSFKNLIIGIGLQNEQQATEEEARHWIIILLVYLITLLTSPFTALYKNDNLDKTSDDIETTLDEQINIFEEGINSAYNNPSDEASEILAMIASFLEMVRLSIRGSNSSTPTNQTISGIESDNFDISSTSLLSVSGNSEHVITNNDSLSNSSLLTEKPKVDNYALVPVYKDEVLHHLNLETFFKEIDALIKSNINRLNSDAIDIPDDIAKKLLPMMAELKKLLHNYQSEESWALQYRKQKREIAKLIHPDSQKNKEAAALIFPAVTHFLFEAIDKLIERLDSGKPINTYDEELESLFADIRATFKNAEETIKRAKRVLKETRIFHQEVREQIQKIDEKIAEIDKECQIMSEELRHANREMSKILKRQDIRIEKMDALYKETVAILKESKHSRLMSDLVNYHNEKSIAASQKSIQESTADIYSDISIINGILDKHGLSVIENAIDEPKPNIHQLFTEKSSLTDQHTKEHHDIALDFGKC